MAGYSRSAVPTIRTVPRFLTAGVRRCLIRCLNDLQVAYRRRDEPAWEAAWKLFLLAPCCWPVANATYATSPELTQEACERVRQGQLTRARQTLSAAALAPGNDATLHALSDPSRRPPLRRREIPAEVLSHEPAEAVALSVQQVVESLRSAKRGSAPGLSGATVDHYKLLLDDPTALELLAFAVNCFARADLPPGIIDALALSRLTALRKPEGGVRGIASGDVFRRLVSRALARALAGVFDEATRPYQFALSTPAGTDSLAAMLRIATELDPEATVVSLDGRSAYDSVSRAAMLGKLKQVAPQILPFVRSLYARVSTYLWGDDAGHCHEIQQAEGVEQGDSLAPALFALSQHDALAAAARQLEAGEFLAAFLDDIYVVTSPPRARGLLDAVTNTIELQAGVAANLCKTRVYHAQGHQQSVGSLHWACPLATTSSSGPAPTLAWRKSAGC